jgi:hypothetical protein
MKQDAQCDGFSARQRTIRHHSLIFMLMLLLSLTGCHEKSNGQQHTSDKSVATAQDSTRKPDVKIQVNKRYDDKGNLIGFDSLYSSYYSTIPGDSLFLDSMIGGFEKYFNRHHPTFFDNRMNPLFFSDTLRYPDFFHEDFFQQHLRMNDAYMRDMMRRMDSIKNGYYSEHFRRNPKTPSKDKTS